MGFVIQRVKSNLRVDKKVERITDLHLPICKGGNI